MAFFVAASADSHVETLLNKLEAKFKTKLQAFRYLDESNNGYVTADDLRARRRLPEARVHGHQTASGRAGPRTLLLLFVVGSPPVQLSGRTR